MFHAHAMAWRRLATSTSTVDPFLAQWFLGAVDRGSMENHDCGMLMVAGFSGARILEPAANVVGSSRGRRDGETFWRPCAAVR